MYISRKSNANATNIPAIIICIMPSVCMIADQINAVYAVKSASSKLFKNIFGSEI